MGKDVENIRLVKQAQLGDKESINKLAELAWERLHTDIYRLTMHHDLMQEIIQESILEMLKILSDLKEPNRFWPWLYKIALNKIRLHHRSNQYRKTVPLSAMSYKDAQKDGQETIANMINEELKEIIFTAMQKLKPRQLL